MIVRIATHTTALAFGVLATAGIASVLGFSVAPAMAQSYTAPAGIPAAVAPGGLEGRTAGVNRFDATAGRGAVLAPRTGDTREITTGSVRRPGAKTAW
jgi:hypothetical protein